MTDEKFTLAQTNRERKSTANGARHRVSGSRSHRVTLPSDNLTPAQIKKLSGPVITYNMDQPHTMHELMSWPKDLQRQYMQKLIDRYHPTNKALAEMLGYASVMPIIQYVKHDLGLNNEKRPTKDDRQDFTDFLLGVKDEETIIEDTTDPDPTQQVTAPEIHLTLTYRGVALPELVKILLTDPLLQSCTGTYDITLTLNN